FFQAEDGIRDFHVTGVQTCALPIYLALASGHSRFAVIGAGVIGLTTALRLIETGADVAIYAAEFPAETRSARATGVWSPSSRIRSEERRVGKEGRTRRTPQAEDRSK